MRVSEQERRRNLLGKASCFLWTPGAVITRIRSEASQAVMCGRSRQTEELGFFFFEKWLRKVLEQQHDTCDQRCIFKRLDWHFKGTR